jgi:DUF1365 family protein
MLIDEIMNMGFLFQYFDIENWVNFSKRLAKLAKTRLEFFFFKSQFFGQRNDKKQKNTHPEAHREIP